jgi:Dipeptidyl aminopeptidases/acylaminoacyl-peptidases
MKKKIFTLLAVMGTVAVMATDIPKVYNVENTGADCPSPPLPSVSELPSIIRLPNPFEMSDGSGVITTFDEWKCRRAEIKAEIEHYEIGAKPPRPANLSATYSGGVLTVVITEGEKSLTLTSNVVIPAGTGPFPIIIGMNSGTGSLSTSLFAGCIQVPFMHNQITSNGTSKNLNAPFYQMYPNLTGIGDYSAWSWGVSRLIDGIEIVKDQMNADMNHIGVTGCSYAGKMALFAGAFDERIALTIAQESGGGGTTSWRAAETLGSVEKISSTNYSWFMPALKNNFDGKVEKLPYDHHELLAMVAPRALLTLGNDGYVWMADEAGYVSCMAAREVYKFLGVEDRFGFDFTGGHNHCTAGSSQVEAVRNFVDKFLYGNEEANTNITTHPYQNVNYQFWISDWSNTQEPTVPLEQYWYEAESTSCSTIGSDFDIIEDTGVSNGKYVTVKGDLSSTEVTPNADGFITIPVYVNNHRDFHVYFRMNCANNNAPFWAQIDNGPFIQCNGLATNGEWQWVHAFSSTLLTGNHILRIGYRENGAKLDRIYVTNDLSELPTGMGGEETDCTPIPVCTILDFEIGNIADWTKQNPGAGIDITQEDKHSGVYALKMVNGTGTSAWSVQAFSPEIPIAPGHVYNVSFWVRAVGGGGSGRISTTGSGQLGGVYWANFNVGEAWQKQTYTNLTANGVTVRLAFDMGYIAGKTYYIDDIVFEDITADPAPSLHVQGGNAWDANQVNVGENLQSSLFSLRNVGSGTINITEISELSAPWSTSLAVGNGISLGAGQVQEFTFAYAPTDNGISTTDFFINTSVGNISIDLRGEGINGPGSAIPDIQNLDIDIFSPSPGKIKIRTSEILNVRIFDAIGRTIKTQTIDSSSELSLSSGYYIVYVENKNKVTHIQKVMVQ